MATLGAATHTIVNGGASTTAMDIDVAVVVGGLFTTSAGVVDNTTRIDHTASPYTVLATDNVLYCDTDGGAITVNLPAGIEGTRYKILNAGSSGNDITVDPNGTEELFNGGAGVSQLVADGEVIEIHYNATEGWH